MTTLSNTHRIHLSRPASLGQWEHAMPIGNGRLGAMIFGGVGQEHLRLNEETIWSRWTKPCQNPDALTALPRVRQLLLDGRPDEAEFLADTHMMGAPNRLEPYQEMGYLEFRLKDHLLPAEQYERSLDLTTAIATVCYQIGGHRYERQMFVSAPDDVLVMRMTCDKPGGINAWFGLLRAAGAEPGQISPDTIDLVGRAGEHGTRFRAVARAIVEGGRAHVGGKRLRVDEADSLTLLICAATDYWGDEDFARTALDKLDAAAAKTFEQLRDAHVADYRSFYDRMELTVPAPSPEVAMLTTDQRLERVRQGEDDPDLVKLQADFGRYLLISSSRPGGLPANLQGIWATGLKPPWDADFHVNINLQMNYWLAEVCGLGELTEPVFSWMTRCVVPEGRRTARIHYDCGGWMMHHVSDPWGYTVPSGPVTCGLWPMGGAWMCDHAWERYLYGGDERWLSDVGYPLMRGASEFFLDYLVEDASGQLLCGPSDSPENKYLLPDGRRGALSMGCTMDNQILTELFSHTRDAARVLGRDEELAGRLDEAIGRLPKMKIGKHGQIQEWLEDYDEAEPGHRHMSHLFGLHPGTQIDPWRTPELIDGARRVLERRLAHGGGHTGWSKAWMINFYARLLDADATRTNINQMLSKCMLPNLLDTHPPFQIDGNFGFTAAIAEMLVQSHADCLVLMPAWPASWGEGNVRGLRVRGGAELSMSWAGGRPRSATLTAMRDGEHRLRLLNGQRIASMDCDGRPMAADEREGIVLLRLSAGERVRIRFG